MNRILATWLTAILAVSSLAWEVETAGELLKVTNRDIPVLEEIGLTGKAAREKPLTWSRKWEKISDDEIRLRMDASFAPTTAVPEYRMRIPAACIDGAAMTAVGIVKNNREPLEMPQGTSWTLDNVVFLTVSKGDLSFSLDFEDVGPMLFQHAYNDCPSATLIRTADGLEIVIPRRYTMPGGGLYQAQAVMRRNELDYKLLHGTVRGHYKKTLPVNLFLSFTPEKIRPVAIGGTLIRDFDSGLTKRYSKAVLVSIIKAIPPKFGGGGWSAYKQIKYSENHTENPLYKMSAHSAAPQELTMNLPAGFFFLTFYTRDDSLKAPLSYSVTVGDRLCTIGVRPDAETETRIPVRVGKDGVLTLRFPKDKREWRLCGLSATWICGLADLSADVSKMQEYVQ